MLVRLTILIRAVVTELHNHLVGTRVERVKLPPLFLLQAFDRVRLDALYASLHVSTRRRKTRWCGHESIMVIRIWKRTECPATMELRKFKVTGPTLRWIRFLRGPSQNVDTNCSTRRGNVPTRWEQFRHFCRKNISRERANRLLSSFDGS